jgi:hypothetical protein
VLAQVGSQNTRDHRTPVGDVLDDPLGVRARRELAVPPHLRRDRSARHGLVPAR